ncbi:hypothetical protein Tco_0325068 [Tanacetum coccineum]
MKQYSESTPEGIELILWGDLKIMMESSIEVTDQGDFWNDQQDWEIVTWRLYEACGVCILEFKDGTVIHMLVERKYPLSKELLQRMLDFGLEVEVESTAALDLIRVLNSPCFMVKSWLVQDQTVLGKDYSNLLIADSLLKTIWFINAPCYGNEALASPKANGVCCDAEEMRCKFKIESEREDDQNINNQPPNPPPPTQQAPHTVSTIKLPILKKGEYDIWAMKMEHYLAHTDYPVWEVIQNGNGPVSISTDTQGQIKILPPKSAEEILARERERKARTTLLMALPEDHLARFHNISDAKEMWDAIKTRFGGNAKNTGYKGRDQRTGKQEQPKALLTIDAGVIDWSGQAEEEEEDHALMAFNSNSSSNEMRLSELHEIKLYENSLMQQGEDKEAT